MARVIDGRGNTFRIGESHLPPAYALAELPADATEREAEASEDKPLLRHEGVYRFEDKFFVALYNDDIGGYSYALAVAVPIPGAGFSYDPDREVSMFVGRGDEAGWLFSVYNDIREWFHQHDELVDTGLLAIARSE